MISGIIILLTSFISAVILIGGFGKLMLKISRLDYQNEERLIAVASFGILALSVTSILLYLTGLFNPTSIKILFTLMIIFQLIGFRTPKKSKTYNATVLIMLLTLPSIFYILISPVVEKDLENIITIQHLISTGKYTDDIRLFDFFYGFASASLSSVFDWIPAYNLLSGYGWMITIAMLYGVYLLSNQLFEGKVGVTAALLVTGFQLYSRTIDYRSTLISITFFIYLAYVTAKKMTKERVILCATILLNTLFTSPLGFVMSLSYLLFMNMKSTKWVLAGVAILTALLMKLELAYLLLDYGIILLAGIAGVIILKENSKINAFYITALLLLIAVAIARPYEGSLLYDKTVYDILKDDTIYVIPLSLCLSGAYLINKLSRKWAVYITLFIILIPQQAWFYQSVINLNVPSREEVHSYRPYPGGVSGSPFILPIQAMYIAFRYYDAYSDGLFPVSIYGSERTKLLSYLFYQTDRRGFFSDLTPKDRFQEFEAVMKYTGILDARLNANETKNLIDGGTQERSNIIGGRSVRWLIATNEQAKILSGITLANGKSLNVVFSTDNYAILEAR